MDKFDINSMINAMAELCEEVKPLQEAAQGVLDIDYRSGYRLLAEMEEDLASSLEKFYSETRENLRKICLAEMEIKKLGLIDFVLQEFFWDSSATLFLARIQAYSEGKEVVTREMLDAYRQEVEKNLAEMLNHISDEQAGQVLEVLHTISTAFIQDELSPEMVQFLVANY